MGNPTHGGLLAMLTMILALWEVGFSGQSSSPASVAPPGDLGASWHRQKRSWVWNQFFVLEEYTGEDPLYVGKVGLFPPCAKTSDVIS